MLNFTGRENKNLLKLEILEFKGSYYESDGSHGVKLTESDHSQRMLAHIKENVELNQDPIEIKRMIKQFCPQLLDELAGLQEALKYSETDILRIFGGYDMPVF